MDAQDYFGLFIFICASGAAASTGALFRPGDWYETLTKPAWRPPNWLFGPVWMVLYAMIAVSGWLVWQKTGLAGGAVALAVFGIQLVFNALWSAIFFGMRRVGLAAVEMVLLWASIVATILAFWPIDARAAWLLVPYLFWVSFAFILNVSIWRLNAGGAPAESRTL